jgi:uncharacterized Zn-binding protein involved in type VI secretion
MGKLLSQIGSMASGHGSWPPSPITSGSSNVIIEGVPGTFKGASVAVHVNPSPSAHPRSIGKGSSTVNINGKPAARIGDKINCGGAILQGASTVFSG